MDNELIKGCLENSERCQEMLYKKYYPDILRICIRYSKSRHEAVDILNRAFLKIFCKLDSYNFKGPLMAWMRKIVVNTAIDYYRQGLDLRRTEEDVAEVDVEIDADVNNKISAEEILQMLRSLPERLQIIFNLYAIEGYTHAEIAELLNIPESTSRWHLMQARKLLQEKVKIYMPSKTVCSEGLFT